MTSPTTDQLKAELRRVLQRVIQSRLGKVAKDPKAAQSVSVVGVLTIEKIGDTTAEVRQQLNKEADSLLSLLQLIGTTFDFKIAQGDNLRDALKRLDNSHILKSSPSAATALLRHRMALDLYTSRVQEDKKAVAKLIVELDAAKRSDQLHLLKAATDRATSRFSDVKEHLETLAKELASASSSVNEKVDERAIRAYVSENPDEARKDLQIAVTVLEQIQHFAAALTPSGWKWIPGTIELLMTIATRTASEVLIGKQGEEYAGTHAKGEIFDEHDADPLLVAKLIHRQYNDNVELVLAAIGVAGEEIPGWEIIKKAVKTLVEQYLEKGIEAAQEKLRESPTREKATLVKEIATSVAKHLVELVTDAGEQVKWVLSPEEQATNAAIGTAVAAMIPVIVRMFPPDPADAISGSDMRAALQDVLKSVAPASYFRKNKPDEDILESWTPRRDRDENGNLVEQMLSTVQEHNGNTFQWVRINGVVGALFLSRGNFVPRDHSDCPPAGAELSALIKAVPTTDSEGRPVREVSHSSDLAAGNLYVRVEVHGCSLWGTMNAATLHFVPDKPDQSAFSNWSSRKISLDGYTEGDRKVTGQWYRPWADQHYYLFDDNGSHEWARALDLTANGPGPEYNVDKVLLGRPGRYPWPLFPQR
jgi:hypothetical protein